MATNAPDHLKPRPEAPAIYGRARVATLAAVAGLLLGACAAAPQARLTQAWAAADSGDLGAFVLLFTPPSAELLRGLHAVDVRTHGRIRYVRNILHLLPRGPIGKVTIVGPIAIVTVDAKPKPVNVRLRRERGEWFIDAMSLDALWKPLTRPVGS